MSKTTFFKKGLSLIIMLAILFAMSIPAFAASKKHAAADFVVVSCESSVSLKNYVKLTYKIVTHCTDLNCLKNSTIKVDGKAISSSSFKLDAEGQYVYEGVTYKRTTNSLKIETVDKNVTGSKQVKNIKIKDIITGYPKLYVSLIGSGLGLLKSSVISLSATDNTGIKSITVNGKELASSSDTENKKLFSMVYDVYLDGLYSVVVTDVDGNMTNAYFTVKDGAIESQSAGSYPICGDFDTYIPFYYYFGYSSMAEMMGENPMLFYYYLYYNYDGDFSELYPSIPSLPNVNIPSYGNISSESYLWYLYLNGMFGNDSDIEEDDFALYYVLMLLKSQGDESSNDMFTNMLIYNHLYGNGFSFTDGNKIIVTEVEGTHKLTSPAIVNDKNASYQWQKLIAGKWIDIPDATASEYTLPAIVKGESYRVVISGKYFYSVLTSSVYIAGITGTTTETPSVPSIPSTPNTPSEPSDEFTADDITIKGLAYPMFSIKVGAKVTLMPNCMGYWIVDETLLSSNTNFGTITVTGVKAGKTVISYTGFDGNGNYATKFIFVEVVE